MELIIAIGIILACVLATLTLVISSIQAGRKSSDKIIATNLAREGVEIVRNIRDSNWINVASNIINTDTGDIYKWDDGLVDLLINDPIAIPIINDTSISKLDFTPNSPSDKCSGEECTRIFMTGANYYIQITNPSSIPSSIPTTFYRLLYLNPICQDASGNETIIGKDVASDCGADTKVGIRVISEVDWPKLGKNKVIIEDRLYNWRTQ